MHSSENIYTLKDIGLQKKRYNDGFYYYGILENTRDNKNILTLMKFKNNDMKS